MYRNKITIKQLTTAIDSEGIEQKTVSVFCTKGATVEHRNPSEKWGDGRMKPEVTDLFKNVKYSPGITSDMQIVYGVKRYEIIGVEDIRDEHRELVIQAKEVT